MSTQIVKETLHIDKDEDWENPCHHYLPYDSPTAMCGHLRGSSPPSARQKGAHSSFDCVPLGHVVCVVCDAMLEGLK